MNPSSKKWVTPIPIHLVDTEGLCNNLDELSTGIFLNNK
jgi:hypothetical protein